MNRRFVAAASVAALVGLASAVAIQQPPARDQPDYKSLPPKPAEVQQQLQASRTTLLKAIETAQKEVAGGIARNARFQLNAQPNTIDVLVYAGEKAHRVTINAESGAVMSNEIVPRLPGEPFEGELTLMESGVQFAILRPGAGPALTDPTSAVKVHVTGWLVDGTEFANTRVQDAVTLPLTQMFPGFGQGVTGMKVGEMRKVAIPPDLAYGPQGQPPAIPPEATLVFDIELLGIDPYTPEPPPDKLPGEPVQGEPTVTASGLKYYDLKVGEGEQPAGPQTPVKVHYTGWLVDGTQFDSSFDAGEPVTFPLSGFVPGWAEGVGSMKVGGKRKLIIPYALAFGEGGRPPTIPAKATLIFDVELLEVNPAPPPPPPVPSPPGAPQPGQPGQPQEPESPAANTHMGISNLRSQI